MDQVLSFCDCFPRVRPHKEVEGNTYTLVVSTAIRIDARAMIDLPWGTVGRVIYLLITRGN